MTATLENNRKQQKQKTKNNFKKEQKKKKKNLGQVPWPANNFGSFLLYILLLRLVSVWFGLIGLDCFFFFFFHCSMLFGSTGCWPVHL
jgi:hypothetical protein